MHADQSQLHYAPASVGVLIDPGFLRAAAGDFDGDRRAESAPPNPAWRRCIAIVSAWRHAAARRSPRA